MKSLIRLRDFVVATTRIVERSPNDEPEQLAGTALLLRDLVNHDDWLPDEYATPDPKFYRQCLLHADPLGRFSVISFVWGPGQRTPIHDHRTWGLVGILRGGEISTSYERLPGGGRDGAPRSGPRRRGFAVDRRRPPDRQRL